MVLLELKQIDPICVIGSRHGGSLLEAIADSHWFNESTAFLTDDVGTLSD